MCGPDDCRKVTGAWGRTGVVSIGTMTAEAGAWIQRLATAFRVNSLEGRDGWMEC